VSHQGHANSIVIKGIREGLLVTLEGDHWPGLVDQLEKKLAAMSAFFKGARVALSVGVHSLSEDDIRAVRDLLLRYDVTLWALASDDVHTQQAAAGLGLDTALPPRESRPKPAAPAAETIEVTPEAGLVIRRTVRSGQSVRHTGAIVVIGDVHSGAELIAGSDIIVWGKLHGTVHAGAFGDESAVVCALDLTPMQLRIGRHISRSPDERRRKVAPEMAQVMNGRIEAVAWNPKGRTGR
jgi:septum site-determining protein MinC